MIQYTATYTDLYQLSMAQVYYLEGRQEENALFDYFFRKLPFKGGYAVLAGLENLLDVLADFRFEEKDLQYLEGEGFHPDFLRYLEKFSFRGGLYAPLEGDVVFPTMPIVQVEGNIIEAQIVETLLLNILNFQTLIATKASRMKRVAGNTALVEFGMRRAHSVAAYYASRASVVGGFEATSNVAAGRDFNIKITGTMAHAFVQSHDDELTAFRAFADVWPDDCVLLADTYDTLKSGVPNAITVARELEAKGHHLKGIRLDSGDLAYLSRMSRRMLDEAGLPDVKIAVSNQLDEYVIRSLKEQQAPIDLFGVGTSLATGQPDGALDGVYKMAFAGGKPRIKLSETLSKTTLPGKKQVFRILNDRGEWTGADGIGLAGEADFDRIHSPFDPHKSLDVQGFTKEPLLAKVMENGRRTGPSRSLPEIAKYCTERLNQLPPEYRRFENPHLYKIGISTALKEERDRLMQAYKS